VTRPVPYVRSEVVLHHLYTLFNVGVVAGLTDGQLLEQFVRQRGEAAEVAFAALVERHGPAVLRTCLVIVGNDHDAQDAFQATFLVLVRKGGTLWVEDSLGPWLHRVACRAAARVKVATDQRRAIERRAAKIAGNQRRSDSEVRDDLSRALHEEVDRLPSHYRRPIILCDLEGHSYEEAARHLGCPVGTVRSRLARGRERLRGRLIRRGLAPSAELAGTAIFTNAMPKTVPAALLKSTIQAATSGQADLTVTAGVVSASVTAIVEGVLRAMLMTKIRTMIVLTLAAAVTVTGLGLLARGAADGTPPANQETGKTKVEIAGPPPAPSPTRESNNASIFAVGDANELKVWAYDLGSKTWYSYKALKGTKVRGLATLNIATMSVKGEQITEIAAYCTKVGKWSRQPLSEPVHGEIIPDVRNDYAIYPIGQDVYAFSSLTGTWSRQVLSAPPKRENAPFTSDDCAVYTIGRRAYAFSALKGRWTTLDFDEGSEAWALTGPFQSVLVGGASRLYSFVPQVGRFEEITAKED
jgi:RNA polymerase sigma factor (sigma-70 family)